MYLPITDARGVLLGLLWASLDNKAADFRPNPATRPASDHAHVLWVQRLRDARRYDTAPLTLLERVAADPRYRTGPRQEAPGLSGLPF